MPAQQGGRRHQEDTPAFPAEKAGQAGQDRAVGRGVPRPCHLAAQHSELVAQHGDLDVLLVRRWAEPEEVKEPADEQERDRTSHAQDLARITKPLLKAQILTRAPYTLLWLADAAAGAVAAALSGQTDAYVKLLAGALTVVAVGRV